MNFNEWSAISSDEQKERCQSLNPYQDWGLFKDIEEAFIKQHGSQPGVEKVFCGIGSGLGPLNAITVTIKRGEKRVQVPKIFMGFPVLLESKRGG